MTVQNAQTPCGQDQQTGAWEQHTHDLDRQLAFGAVKSRRYEVDEHGARDNANKDDDGDEKGKNGQHCARHTIPFPSITARNQ